MDLRKLWRVRTLLAVIAMIAILSVVSACTSTPVTVTSTVTSAPTTVTVTATPAPLISQANLDLLKAIGGPPPASLDQFYPPKAPAPVYLLDMINMAGPFDGIGGSLQAQDMAGAKAGFTAFQTQYVKISKEVPEWTSRFHAETVAALGTAIDGGNPAQIGTAMAAVGQLCTDCHLLDQIKVEQKYTWPNFDSIKVTDPVSGKSLAWTDYMTAMAGTYGGALAGLQAGQPAQAIQSLNSFKSQLTTLAKDGCSQCHQDPVTKQPIPRNYYVDAGSMALIDQMAKALAATPPDPVAIGNMAQGIANDICLKCHYVHFPAQNAKDLWSTYANVLK